LAAFFYDSQIRRFLIQFAKIFSNWSVTFGNDPAGNPILVRVPIMYGDQSRQVAAVIANNTPNNLPSVPMITYYISSLEYNQKWTTDPTFVDQLQVRQRQYNENTNSYETTQGQAFSIQRLMPVPYTLKINVDFWTANYNQKLQLIEQLGTLFNPALEIQSTDNFIDWTSLSSVFQDGLNFTSRSIPVGTGNPIDILTWKFYMPIWISTPAKLLKMGVIEKIISSIYTGAALQDIQNDDLLTGTRQKITPYGYKLLLQGNMLQLLPANELFHPPNTDLYNIDPPPNTTLYWSSILNLYGTIRPGISQIWIENPYMATDIVGTIVPNPLDDRFLIYNIDPDTLPQNTLAPINAVINPQITGPNAGLPGPVPGIRYLVVEPIGAIGSPTVAWGSGFAAKANDIIQYDGTTRQWFVAFDSHSDNTTPQFVTNLATNIQYRYVRSEEVWLKSYEGWIDQGNYSIVI
jgi:T4-like virus Myoviridae tail sheath stabiliser